MMAKPMKALEQHYPMIQFLIMILIWICAPRQNTHTTRKAILTRNSSRIKYLALVTDSSSPGSAVAMKEKMTSPSASKDEAFGSLRHYTMSFCNFARLPS